MNVLFKTTKIETLYVIPLNKLGKQKYSRELIKSYKNKIEILTGIDKLEELRNFPGLNFEPLKGDRKGEFSIKLNDQFRLIFIPERGGILLVTEISKHYE